MARLGFLDRVNRYVQARPERFSGEMSIGDPAFAAWLYGTTPDTGEIVTPYTVIGISSVLRSVSIISTTIAGLPLRTYERQGDERVRVPSVFDDPYPGEDGMTPFAWVETVLIHLLLWRKAFLWHEAMDGDGNVTAYKPLLPDTVKTKTVNGRKRFEYRDADGVMQEVGTEQITHIPGPSFDGVEGHPFLYPARRIFSAALAGDKSASTTLSLGIRLAGLVTPGEGEDIDAAEGEEILKNLRPQVLGSERSGDIAFINRRLNLSPWSPTNTDSQWHEARLMAVDEVGRLFGIPPHLLNAIEKQTSWGTGVAEQNFGLARYTLMGWSSRIEQVISRRLAADEFTEFDYLGLLQGTPAQAVELVLKELDAGLVSLEYACKVLNLPPPNTEQKTKAATAVPRPTPVPTPIRQEATA